MKHFFSTAFFEKTQKKAVGFKATHGFLRLIFLFKVPSTHHRQTSIIKIPIIAEIFA